MLARLFEQNKLFFVHTNLQGNRDIDFRVKFEQVIENISGLPKEIDKNYSS